ncbi:hypothetical protein, partial [Acinetobacter baumannii]|uniref:hypothetical protein n=1 Tax=Acinetobacter baumannii TaxID=470 RepID=UPI00148EF541
NIPLLVGKTEQENYNSAAETEDGILYTDDWHIQPKVEQKYSLTEAPGKPALTSTTDSVYEQEINKYLSMVKIPLLDWKTDKMTPHQSCAELV